MSSTGEPLPDDADADGHYVSLAHLEDGGGDSGPNMRQHEHQGQPYRQGNPADGDELPCAVEHSAERIYCKSANLIL